MVSRDGAQVEEVFVVDARLSSALAVAACLTVGSASGLGSFFTKPEVRGRRFGMRLVDPPVKRSDLELYQFVRGVSQYGFQLGGVGQGKLEHFAKFVRLGDRFGQGSIPFR